MYVSFYEGSLLFFFLQPVTVLNDNKLPRALIVQICDSEGNECRVPDYRIQIAKDPKIKVSQHL
jgi:hypothetical protein